MKIIIVGAGRIGSNLASSLSDEEHEVFVIEENEEIAKKVNLTSEAVRYRINKLEKSHIINYRTIIDLKKLNYDQFFILFNFSSITKETENKLIDFVKNNNSLTSNTEMKSKNHIVLDYAKTNLVSEYVDTSGI